MIGDDKRSMILSLIKTLKIKRRIKDEVRLKFDVRDLVWVRGDKNTKLN